jgi:multidrug efflux pump subunit AcrA (membrane-fusion protein)
MDINRAKSKKNKIAQYYPWALALLPVFFAVKYLIFLSQADFSVDSDNMVFGEVKQGEFVVSVRGTGVLVPDHVQWLAASVNARVERLVVKAGKYVKQGELIVVLSNPQLVQMLDETLWELEALEAETVAAKVAQESSLLNQKSETFNSKLNYESSKLKQDAQEQLFRQKTGAVSKLDYEKTRLETKQHEQRWEINEERYVKMQENLIAQNNARGARLNKMKKILERVQQQIEDLNVYATMDSVVQEVPLEPGQQIPMGTNIAKLARQDSLIAELQIPEAQIRSVALGNRVVIDTRNNKVEGIVTRIDPAVTSGNVQVDVEFTQALPTDARPDLTIDGEIMIAEMDNTLHVNRPIFAQSQSHSSLYKLSSDGKFAERVPVTLGLGSVNQIQIVEGLNLGDKIIISDPTSWESYQKIRIN